MKTKNLFRVLPAVAAMLLLAACSSDEQSTAPIAEPEAPASEGTVIHYSATVSDGSSTRATLNSSKQYEFQTGDMLRITGTDISGDLTLTSGAGTANATFEGDLTFIGAGTPASDLVLQAVLVSTSNQMSTLTYASAEYPTTAIASTLAEAVERYSYFKATSTYASKNFSLSQQTSFLNFTVTLTDGTTTGTALDITIKNGGATVRTGSVTTATVSESIVAKFVAAMPSGTTMSSATFQLGSKSAVSFGGTTTLAANKIYNISKTINTPGLLTGAFTVNDGGTQVHFAQGNLQATYNGSSWTWAFAENQWDYIGANEGNNKVSASTPFVSGYSGSSTTVDLFGWVGASSTWTGAAQYGITSSTTTNNTNGYGNGATEALKSDWGNTISDGYTWRTLTGGSGGEWEWILGPSSSPNPGTNCRRSSTVNGTANARFAKATVVGKPGIIIFPDTYTHPDGVTAPSSINTAGAAFTVNSYDATAWGKMETAGCVFLPAAGYRFGTSVYNAGSNGYYWSSTVTNASRAYYVYFYSGYLDPANYYNRYYGFSVRLVRQVE